MKCWGQSQDDGAFPLSLLFFLLYMQCFFWSLRGDGKRKWFLHMWRVQFRPVFRRYVMTSLSIVSRGLRSIQGPSLNGNGPLIVALLLLLLLLDALAVQGAKSTFCITRSEAQLSPSTRYSKSTICTKIDVPPHIPVRSRRFP